MQPTPPNAPNPPAAGRPRYSSGPGVLVGVIALLVVVYLVDHASKGEAAIFSSADRHISAQDFRGAQCTAVFGSCKIDLRDAQILGREAVLDAYAVFGGVEVRVPEDWEVVNHSVALFGGLGDRRQHNPRGPETKTLILQGVAVFGGVQVKN
jgi:hypothetical protein